VRSGKTRPLRYDPASQFSDTWRQSQIGEMQGPAVSAGYVRSLLALAVKCGADAQLLLAAARIDPRLMDTPDVRVPFERFKALMAEAKAACREPALALHFGAAPLAEVPIAGLIAHAAGSMGRGVRADNPLSPPCRRGQRGRSGRPVRDHEVRRWCVQRTGRAI
jgi:hypothetical protein